MQNLPAYIALLFILTTAATVWFLFKASKNSGLLLITALAWLTLHAALAYAGFYTNLSTMPPRFVFLVGPPMVFILLLLLTPKGRTWLDKLDLKTLTLLHVVRIPVEITLYLLFLNSVVPKIMTFEGTNPDILSGISAIIVVFLFFKNGQPKKYALMLWNLVCLGLLVNIVYHAFFSTPYPFQKFGFDQPNIAVFYFPFIWLPGFVVPAVLLAHVASLRQLLKR